MADEKKIVTQDILEKAVSDVLQIVVDNVYEEEEYTEDEVSNLFDADKQTIDYYSSLISDTLVSENRIFSSKHVSDLLQQFQLDANAYADEIATRTLTTEIVTATSEVTKENVLYLILSDSSTNTYEQYMLIGGNATPLGSTKIDLSDVYTKSEIDTKLADKANSSEVLAVNKVQTATGSETNDTVYSSKLTKTELDKKANDNEVVKKTDISTTIDSTSTDDKIPSAKAVFTPIDKIQSSLTSLTPVLDLNNFKGKTFIIGRGTGYNNECANVPNGIAGAFVVEYFPYDDGELYGVQRLTLVQAFGGKYITFERSLDNGNWMGWQKVCTTSVADVPKTNITTNSDTTYYEIEQAHSFYIVKNGICTVNLVITCNSVNDDWVQVVYNMPKPLEQLHFSTGNMYDSSLDLIYAKIETDCIIKLRRGGVTSGAKFYWLSFSYQVAES